MPFLTDESQIPEKGRGAKITSKMARFCEEYMVDLNGTAAVLRAGYTTNNPTKRAVELMAHPHVKKYLGELKEKRMEKTELTADYVLLKLQQIVEDTETNNPQAALRGLELLGKHLGLYKDRQEISGPDGASIQMEQKVQRDVTDFTSRIASLAKRNGTDGVTEFPKPTSEG